jgi:hypothetical protein
MHRSYAMLYLYKFVYIHWFKHFTTCIKFLSRINCTWFYCTSSHCYVVFLKLNYPCRKVFQLYVSTVQKQLLTRSNAPFYASITPHQFLPVFSTVYSNTAAISTNGVAGENELWSYTRPVLAVNTALLRATHRNKRKYRAFYKWFLYRKPKHYIKLRGWKGRYFTVPSDGCNHHFTVNHSLVGFYNWDAVCLLRGTFYIVRSAHTVYLCVLCGSENKQRLFHCTILTGWFL